jgi:hypothetical protein
MLPSSHFLLCVFYGVSTPKVNVQEQVAWVCEGCDAGSMKKHEEEFPGKNKEENSLEKWALWLQGIVAERLGEFRDVESYEARASELLLRWSFISSLIMRELTLRSAASFGPFHLLRLLCDDYMYFLVEIAVAENGCRPVAHVPGGEWGGELPDMSAGGGAAGGGAAAATSNIDELPGAGATAADGGGQKRPREDEPAAAAPGLPTAEGAADDAVKRFKTEDS